MEDDPAGLLGVNALLIAANCAAALGEAGLLGPQRALLVADQCDDAARTIDECSIDVDGRTPDNALRLREIAEHLRHTRGR